MSATNVMALERRAQNLLGALDAAACVERPTLHDRQFDLAAAFAVGERLRQLRVARGERPLGWKIGFTNRTIWDRYGVHAPIWGPVWDSTVSDLAAGRGSTNLRGLCQPRLEPEIVFGFRAPPSASMNEAALRACIEWVAHGFEIVHTHFTDWRFAAADTVADFALHGRLFIGPRLPFDGKPGWAGELAALRVELLRDGEVVDRGIGANVLDGPLAALRTWIAAMAEHTPQWRVAAGEVVTTGTITDAWPLAPGQRWQTRLSDDRLTGLALEIVG